MASGRHADSTPEEPDPIQDTCEEPSLSAEDQKHKGSHSRVQTDLGFMHRRSASLPCWNELSEAFPCWSTSRGTCSSGRQPVGPGSPGLARQTPGGRLAGRLLARQPRGSVGTRRAETSPVEIKQIIWCEFPLCNVTHEHLFCTKMHLTLLSWISIRTSGFRPFPPPARPAALACLTGVCEGELRGVHLQDGAVGKRKDK